MHNERQEYKKIVDIIVIGGHSNSIATHDVKFPLVSSLNEVQVEDTEDWLYIKPFFKNSLVEEVQIEDTEDWLYIKPFFNHNVSELSR